MQAILFINQGNATQACNIIDVNVRNAMRAAGYTVDASGGITGKDGNGNEVTGAQKTDRWDTPHAVGGGKVTVGGAVTTAYSYWILDPRPSRGANSMDNVQNWTAGDYQHPVNTDEV